MSTSNKPQVLNVAAYKFVAMDNLPARKKQLLTFCRKQSLKGTILLSPEGINLFVAGSRRSVDSLLDELRADPKLADLETKESFSETQPFERMLVKIKREIIAFGVSGISPGQQTSPKLPPSELREWLREGRDLTLLDVRNDYEIEVGTFQGAVPIGVHHFRDFPKAVESLPPEIKKKPIVMFCTGGIRCEKAGPMMERAGFPHVYQLEGGILKYFEECGGEFYQGECFVFDKRVALDPNLNETETVQCYACQAPLSREDQASPLYNPPESCPKCHGRRLRERIAKRQAKLQQVTNPLPGGVPYDNIRPMSVPLRLSGKPILEFLTALHPHVTREEWQTELQANRIVQSGQPVAESKIVQAGEQYGRLFPGMVEPEVNACIDILHEDEALIAVNKPAPLPMHACGRFHRNTLEWILRQVYRPLKPRPAHRLDANTTGVVLLTTTRAFASQVQPQFEQLSVVKTYLARVQGHPDWESRTARLPISRERNEAGSRRCASDGLPAETQLTVQKRFSDRTALVTASPRTGRTNQIRLHLASLGHPVLGDPLYLPGNELGQLQTLSPSDPPMCLHALSIRIVHPLTQQEMDFTAPEPDWAIR